MCCYSLFYFATSCTNFFSRNGRWRSVWTIREEGGQVEVTGILKVQVHYYEDGNVQLVSSKEIKETITKSVSIVAVVIRHPQGASYCFIV